MSEHQVQFEVNRDTRVMSVYCPVCEMSRQIDADGNMRTICKGDQSAFHVTPSLSVEVGP